MASTYTQIYLHIVFSTKNRTPWIAPSWRDRLHRYLAGGVRALNARCIAVGGVEDHVHILAEFTSSHCLKDFMRDLKTASSKWVHQEIHLPDFIWQEGYAAFSVSGTAKDQVIGYIQKQEIHHLRKPFLAELTEMLTRAGIACNPQFLR